MVRHIEPRWFGQWDYKSEIEKGGLDEQDLFLATMWEIMRCKQADLERVSKFYPQCMLARFQVAQHGLSSPSSDGRSMGEVLDEGNNILHFFMSCPVLKKCSYLTLKKKDREKYREMAAFAYKMRPVRYSEEVDVVVPKEITGGRTLSLFVDHQYADKFGVNESQLFALRVNLNFSPKTIAEEFRKLVIEKKNQMKLQTKRKGSPRIGKIVAPVFLKNINYKVFLKSIMALMLVFPSYPSEKGKVHASEIFEDYYLKKRDVGGSQEEDRLRAGLNKKCMYAKTVLERVGTSLSVLEKSVQGLKNPPQVAG